MASYRVNFTFTFTFVGYLYIFLEKARFKVALLACLTALSFVLWANCECLKCLINGFGVTLETVCEVVPKFYYITCCPELAQSVKRLDL